MARREVRREAIRAAEKAIDEERLREVLRVAGAEKHDESAAAALRSILEVEAAEIAADAVELSKEIGRRTDACCVACATRRRARSR